MHMKSPIIRVHLAWSDVKEFRQKKCPLTDCQPLVPFNNKQNIPPVDSLPVPSACVDMCGGYGAFVLLNWNTHAHESTIVSQLGPPTSHLTTFM